MTNSNNSSDNWKTLRGYTLAPFGTNKEIPVTPHIMPEKAVEVLSKNGADIQLLDKKKSVAKINGEINEEMMQGLIISFYGNEYWNDVKNQDNLVEILLGALGYFNIEASLVEKEGVLKSIKIRGTAELETKEGV